MCDWIKIVHSIISNESIWSLSIILKSKMWNRLYDLHSDSFNVNTGIDEIKENRKVFEIYYLVIKWNHRRYFKRAPSNRSWHLPFEGPQSIFRSIGCSRRRSKSVVFSGQGRTSCCTRESPRCKNFANFLVVGANWVIDYHASCRLRYS